MVKAVDRAAVISDVRVLAKSGGRRGDWTREDERMSDTALVISVSTRAAAGVYADTLRADHRRRRCRDLGFAVDAPLVVPDGDAGRRGAAGGGAGRVRRGGHHRRHRAQPQ